MNLFWRERVESLLDRVFPPHVYRLCLSFFLDPPRLFVLEFFLSLLSWFPTPCYAPAFTGIFILFLESTCRRKGQLASRSLENSLASVYALTTRLLVDAIQSSSGKTPISAFTYVQRTERTARRRKTERKRARGENKEKGEEKERRDIRETRERRMARGRDRKKEIDR